MLRQLTAIMFTDMVGFTALMQEDEHRAKRHRDRQRQVLERSVARFDGRVLQYYGDGTLSVFQSAVSAVEVAIAIQEALRAGTEPIPLRIGIHSGDVVHDEHGVFGDGVNVASRIQGLGVPGSVLVSGKVFDEIKNQPGIRTRALGSFSLKNIKHPMRVYAVANKGLEIPPETALRPDRMTQARSIAVLPFVNMSSDPENEFFSDGVTEEIINALTRVNGLQVTARTSSFAFKRRNEDIRSIADTLGVTHVLEGSVRRAGNRVRVTAQLICAKDGYHMMSEVYDGALDDIFALQDRVAREIVTHLADRLAPVPTSEAREGSERLVRGHSHDSEAYAEYLRGRFAFARWSPQTAREAIEHYDRSIELDPECALPYAGLAKAYAFLGAVSHLPGEDAYTKAEAAAKRALELEESAGEAHGAMAVVQLFRHHDWDAAYRSFQKSLSLIPGSAEIHQLYAMYLRALGDVEGSLAESRAALDLDPLSTSIRHAYAEALLAAGDLDEAEAELKRVLAADPSFRAAVETLGITRISRGDLEGALEYFESLPHRAGHRFAGAAVRGYAYALLGRTEDAHEMLRLLEQREATDPDVSLALDKALIHQGLGNYDEMFSWLDEAVDQYAGGVVFIGASWFWFRDEVRGDPRFEALLRRIGFPGAAAAAA